MTNDSHLFYPEYKNEMMQLYEGKMIHQFNHYFGKARYWVIEKDARKAVLGRREDKGERLDYQDYRLGFRKIARNTDERTMISTIISSNFHAENFQSVKMYNESGNRILSYHILCYLCALWNSFVVDYLLRMRVSANINFFYVYQLPIPCLTEADDVFFPIVERAAKLICTSPEFDDLAREIFGPEATAASIGATDPLERAQYRAQLDGIIAHLYGLTEEEFAYILTTFPIVKQDVKDAALAEYRALMPLVPDPELWNLIQNSETLNVEFKATVRYNLKTQLPDKTMERMVLKTVAAFLNSEGGTLLIGVADDGKILGLASDYSTFGKRPGKDGYENWLTSLLLDNIGKIFSPYIGIRFYAFAGKEICRVDVITARQPAYVKDGNQETFYIRTNNSTRPLTPRETGTYCLEKWKNGANEIKDTR